MDVALILAAFLSLTIPSGATPALTLKVSGDQTRDDINSFVVTANVTNTSDESLKLYQDPYSVLSTVPVNSFVITPTDGNENAIVEFVGLHVKYNLKTATNFITLEPGSSAIVNHDLLQAYSFNQVGDYNINANPVFFYQDRSGSPIEVQANTVSPYVAKVLDSAIVTRQAKKRDAVYGKGLVGREEHMEKQLAFQGCTNSQQLTIGLTVTAAINYIGDSLKFLKSMNSGVEPYTTWFGAYTSSRRDKVFSHFDLIYTDNIDSYTYSCECNDDTWDSINRRVPKFMLICPGFWRAPIVGLDSKAGGIIFLASL